MERGTVTATVGDILSLIDDMAPFDTQAEWDNAGLLAGAPGKPVTKVLAALDVSVPVIEEAIKLGAELILTHHPILFHARKNLREDDPEGALLCALIRSGRSLIAAHTNFDQAEGGVNDVLARALGLQNIVPLDEGLRVGDFPGENLTDAVARGLDASPWVYGEARGAFRRVAVCGGAGGSLWEIAHAAGAQAYVTGEAKYADALLCAAAGTTLILAGHDKTERLCVKAMRNGLQKRLDAIQYNVRVFESAARSY